MLISTWAGQNLSTRWFDILVTREDATCVKAPPMVGPTWTRVRFVLGSDCLPTLFQGTILPLPSLSARACSMSDVCDLGVVLVPLIRLVIMCVGACLHGILYPMMGCVLYLDGVLWW